MQTVSRGTKATTPSSNTSRTTAANFWLLSIPLLASFSNLSLVFTINRLSIWGGSGTLELPLTGFVGVPRMKILNDSRLTRLRREKIARSIIELCLSRAETERILCCWRQEHGALVRPLQEEGMLDRSSHCVATVCASSTFLWRQAYHRLP